MKYLFAVVLLAILAAGCTKSTKIEFIGTTPGITNGSFMIRNLNDSVVCNAKILNEKFSVTQEWPGKGYYYLTITKPSFGSQTFDVYLEPGKYTITTNREKLYEYPAIQSTSKKQNELTAYYHLSDTINERLHQTANSLNAQLKDPKSKLLPAGAYNDLVKKTQEAQQQELKQGTIDLSAFVDKYPDNEIAPRLIALNNAYMTDPQGYYKIYQKLSPAIKNGPDGKYVSGLLDSLVKRVNK